MSVRTIRLVPPQLSLQPALFAPDPARAAMLRWLRTQRDVETRVEEGTRTAPAIATALVAAGAERVHLVGNGADAAVSAVLQAELQRMGLPVEPVVLAVGDAEADADVFPVECDESVEQALVRLRATIAARGSTRLRLLPPAVATPVALTRDLAALRPVEMRARLLALTAMLRPACTGLLQLAAQWSQLGLDPLLQTFAGNGIADRNRDLVVNIVP